MLENDLELAQQQNSNEYVSFNEYLSYLYPQMILPSPLTFEEIDAKDSGMHTEEKHFAELLLSKNLIVYREPFFPDFESNIDFFVFNPNNGNGKLVEITQLSKDPSKFKCGKGKKRAERSKQKKKTLERKERQITNLKGCGIPYVILYKEEMKNIR